MKLTSEDRTKFLSRHALLKAERSQWDQQWKEIAKNVRPRAYRWPGDRQTAGQKKNRDIINTTPTKASRTLSSGMMSGITSPSRPWFRLTTEDLSASEEQTVKEWLSIVEQRMFQVIAKSNVYNTLFMVYQDLGDFGTAAMFVENDEQDVVRAYHLPLGQYCLISGARQDIVGIYREVEMSVSQMVELFGLEGPTRVSYQVADLYRQGRYDQWFWVVHLICPNEQFDEKARGTKGMKYQSVWFEKNGNEPDTFLRIGGFKTFPVMAPRWSTTGEDTYGNSPGFDGLGDMNMLQIMEKRKLQNIDKATDPPMKGPSSLMGARISLLPGDITFVDALSPGQSFMPAMEVNPNTILILGNEIKNVEQRINADYFADLWLSIIQSEGTMTAREVIERREEKMLQLGTVLERLHRELLSPLLDRIYEIMLERGMIPKPPQEIQGSPLKVEYISIMAQAQKLLGTTGIERFFAFAGNLSQIHPDVLDKVDFDEAVDRYGDMLGVPPSMIRADESVVAMRKQKRAQQAQQAQMEQAQAAAKTGKDLANSDLSGDNALSTMLKGYGAA